MCWELQSAGLSNSDSNHGNGKCLGTYWSVALAAPGFGWVTVPATPGLGYGAPQYCVPASWVGGEASGLPRSWA